jgi:hypothetical protein
MLKISIAEDSQQYRVILEGKLIAPWTIELMNACKAARPDLSGRQLILDVRGLTAISPEGESVLLKLMNESVTFQCGVFMKEVLRQLAHKLQKSSQGSANKNSGLDEKDQTG